MDEYKVRFFVGPIMKKIQREPYETDRDVSRRPRRQKLTYCFKCDVSSVKREDKSCPVCGLKYTHWRKTEKRIPWQGSQL